MKKQLVKLKENRESERMPGPGTLLFCERSAHLKSRFTPAADSCREAAPSRIAPASASAKSLLRGAAPTDRSAKIFRFLPTEPALPLATPGRGLGAAEGHFHRPRRRLWQSGAPRLLRRRREGPPGIAPAARTATPARARTHCPVIVHPQKVSVEDFHGGRGAGVHEGPLEDVGERRALRGAHGGGGGGLGGHGLGAATPRAASPRCLPVPPAASWSCHHFPTPWWLSLRGVVWAQGRRETAPHPSPSPDAAGRCAGCPPHLRPPRRWSPRPRDGSSPVREERTTGEMPGGFWGPGFSLGSGERFDELSGSVLRMSGNSLLQSDCGL